MTIFSRMRAVCLNPQGIEMKVTRPDFAIPGVRQRNRSQDINTGDRAFDLTHVVTGSDDEAVRRLLADVDARRALTFYQFSDFVLTDHDRMLKTKKGVTREGISLFRLTWTGVDEDQDQDHARLKSYFSMFERMLVKHRALSSPESALEPGARPFLDDTRTSILRELAWLSAVVERSTDGLTTRLRLPRGSETFVGSLDVTTAVFPDLDCSVSMRSQIPFQRDPIVVKTPLGVSDSIANLADTNIGIPKLDAALLIRARPEAVPLLVACAGSLEALLSCITAAGTIEFRCEEESLSLNLSSVLREDIPTVARIITSIWKRVCDPVSE